MLQLSTIYYNRKILSLRNGGVIGQALSPVINPNNLKIEGWYAQAASEKGTKILLQNEVRDIIARGIVVDDHTALTPAEDLIRLREVVELSFELIGKSVISEEKKKLGKIQDYAVDDMSMLVQRLYVAQTLLKNFSTQQLIIERSQIIEINDHHIIVKAGSVREKTSVKAPALI